MDITLRGFSNAWIPRLGVALALIPLGFVTAAVLDSQGFALLSRYVDIFAGDPFGLELMGIFWPGLFFGALGFSLAANLYPLLRLELSVRHGRIAGTFAITPRAGNLAVAVVSGLLLAAMLTYAVVENLAPYQ
jgi:hypothetical protein